MVNHKPFFHFRKLKKKNAARDRVAIRWVLLKVWLNRQTHRANGPINQVPFCLSK